MRPDGFTISEDSKFLVIQASNRRGGVDVLLSVEDIEKMLTMLGAIKNSNKMIGTLFSACVVLGRTAKSELVRRLEAAQFFCWKNLVEEVPGKKDLVLLKRNPSDKPEYVVVKPVLNDSGKVDSWLGNGQYYPTYKDDRWMKVSEP